MEPRCEAVVGYDIPPYAGMAGLQNMGGCRAAEGHRLQLPVRPERHGEANTPGYPAPPDIAVQMYQRGTYSTMPAKLQSGHPIKQVIAWAKDELEGFVRS